MHVWHVVLGLAGGAGPGDRYAFVDALSLADEERSEVRQ
jgi:hypothetical protein